MADEEAATQQLAAELLASILQFLDYHALLAAEGVCREWRIAARTQWPQLFQTLALPPARELLDLSSRSTRDLRVLCRHAQRVREQHESGALRCYQVISDVLWASSTDSQHESALNVLDDRVECDSEDESDACYWSSAGGPEDGTETLVFQLLSSVCLVESVEVAAFRASFQGDDVVYAPKALRISLGEHRARSASDRPLACARRACELAMLTRARAPGHAPPRERAAGLAVFDYSSPLYELECTDAPQRLQLPRALMTCGDVLRIDLVGKYQQQEEDGLFYTCLSYVHCFGAPVEPVWLARGEVHLGLPPPAPSEASDAASDDTEESKSDARRSNRSLLARAIDWASSCAVKRAEPR